MKQTILEYQPSSGTAAGFCTGKLLFRFALYSWGIWWLDRLAGSSPAAQTLVWGVALLLGAALAFAAWEAPDGAH